MNMTAFEKHLGRPMVKGEEEHEREWYVAKLYTKKQMEARWKKIGYIKPVPKQLTLF